MTKWMRAREREREGDSPSKRISNRVYKCLLLLPSHVYIFSTESFLEYTTTQANILQCLDSKVNEMMISLQNNNHTHLKRYLHTSTYTYMGTCMHNKCILVFD